jgi:hypothetical protein
MLNGKWEMCLLVFISRDTPQGESPPIHLHPFIFILASVMKCQLDDLLEIAGGLGYAPVRFLATIL